MKARYIFNYFTGYGYREIAPHTIKFYPIEVVAESLEEAIKKHNKRRQILTKYNDCYRKEGTIPIIKRENKVETIGIFWIKDSIIKWKDEECYWKPIAFGNTYMQKFKIPQPDYPTVNNDFAANFCTGRAIYSYKGWFKYVWDYFGGNGDKQSLLGNKKKDLQKNYHDDINNLLTKARHLLTPEEILELEEINIK